MNQIQMDNPRPAVRKWLLIILIIVAVLGAAFFAWYYLMGPGKKVESTTTTPTTTDKTAGWKTYENEEISFSFKYPQVYTIEKDNIPWKSNVGDNLVIKGENDNPILTLWVDPDGFGPFFPNITYNLKESGQGIEIAKRTVEEQNENQTKDSTLIIAQDTSFLGSHHYLFHFSYKSGKDLEETFKTILSTFKFTTPKTSTTTSTDITCTNDTYGFTYTLPTDWKVCKSKEATFDGSVKTYYIQIATTDSNFTAGDEIQDAGYYSPFAITVYTPAQWAEVEAEGGPAGQKITENSNYVFTWNQANGVPPSDFTEAMQNQIQDIIDSFKLK